MSDEYQKMSELLDNWLSDNEKNARFALIEKEILLEKEIDILVGLGGGPEAATAWGCDLTYDYVKINGDYRT